MAQLMKRTLVFGAGVAGLAAPTQTASADTETKHLTLEEVRAENAKRIATYETEKREIDERNRVKRAQYRDAYTQYAELADRGGVEPQEPEYEPLPTLELLEEPIELPFDVNDVTPVETVVNGDTVNDAKEVVTTPEVKETGAKEETTSETKETGAKEETTEAVTSEVKETGAKEETTEVVAPEVKETGAKEETTSETKETGAKEETTSESKETGEKTSSDAVAAQLEGEKTSSDAVAAQLKQTSEETTSSSDAAAQVNKIEAEKTTETTTQSETPTETTSSADAAAQVAKLEAEKSAKTETSETTTTQSDEVKTTESAPTTTDTSEKSNENGGVQARGDVTTTEKTDGDKKTSDSLPHTGDVGGFMSLMGVALSGLGGIGIRRKRK